MTPKLTSAQAALLERVRKCGKVTLSGRARKTVEALARAGFVKYEFTLVPHAGLGTTAFGRWTERFTVTLRDAS